MYNTDLEKIISKELFSSCDNVGKLQNLNKNSELNNYLKNKEHKELVKTIIQLIDNGTHTTNNVNVLKHYLHELSLIFNLNISKSYLPGVDLNEN